MSIVSLMQQSEKEQFKTLVLFSTISVVDTKLIFGYNFIAPFIKLTYLN